VLLSGTNIKIETRKTNIQQCRIVPKLDSYVIEIVYNVGDVKEKEDNKKYCGVDIGLNNLATLSSNDREYKAKIINGRPLKSINQYYNKKLAYYKSILEKRNGKKSSNRTSRLTNKRNNKVNDYLHKASRYIVNDLVNSGINTIVIGNNKEWKQEINIGSKNNQNFVSIPHSTFIQKIEYKARLEGIRVIITEESYTSKCSFLDLEEMVKKEVYLGKRVKRGLFVSSKGVKINADLNGSYNIIRKVSSEAFADGIEGLAVNPFVYTIK